MDLVWTFAPVPLVLALMLVLLATLGLLLLRAQFNNRWQAFGATRAKSLIVMGLSVLSLILLTAAVANPIHRTTPNEEQYHLAVVIDVSNSVLQQNGWEPIRDGVVLFLQSALRDLPENIRPDSPVSLITFGDGRNQRSTTLLGNPDNIVNAVRQLSPADFADSRASDIGASLLEARNLIERGGSRGEVLLVTDGNDTEGGALAAAENLGQQGIPITILPVSAGEPSLALTALNLPQQVNAETLTNLRYVIQNQSNVDFEGRLAIEPNIGLTDEDTLFGAPMPAISPIFTLPSGAYVGQRQGLTFAGVGIQYVDVSLQNAEFAVQHRRRLFTHVVRPLRVLAYGDSSWVNGVSPDVMTVDQQTDPATLGSPEQDLTQYDVLVISGLPASTFETPTLERVVKAVFDDGLGFMLMNGDHEGLDEQSETVLRTYDTTPIESILPVNTDPMEIQDEPPPRNIVMIIDTSGSMAGFPLEVAQALAEHIITNLLLPNDTLNIIAFNDTASYLVQDRAMTDNGKVEAVASLNSLSSGGGTQPSSALNLLGRQPLSHCGLIFLSDGFFAEGEILSSSRPDCRATVFGIGQSSIDPSSPLNLLSDPIPIDDYADISHVVIPFFEAEPRDKFFEYGAFLPLSLASIGGEDIAVPNLIMDGAAVTQLHPDREPEMVVVRPIFRDPVLVYREEGAGIVGVLTTRIPDTWTEFPDGQEAIEQWIVRTVAYYDRDRYSFEITDSGDLLSLHLEIHNEDGSLPDVQTLNTQIHIGEQTYDAIISEEGDATFTITIPDMPRTETAQVAILEIEETSGIDALPRPQRIPILIPPRAAVSDKNTSEDSSFGTDEALLQHMAQLTGGIFAPDADYRFFQSTAQIRDVQRPWRWLLVAAMLSYILSIVVRRFWRTE